MRRAEDAGTMDGKKPLVLVADDDSSMREVVSEHLQSVGYDVLVAEDGREALELTRKHRPDVVLLDVMMPETSGWEVCRTIREEPALAATSVLMLTGIGHTVNSMTSPLYDADAYMDKPFEFAELDAKLREAMQARAQKRSGANGVAGPSRPGPKKAAPKKAEPKKAAPKKKVAPKKKAKAAPKKKAAAPKKAAPKKKVKAAPKKKAAAPKKAKAAPKKKAKAAPKKKKRR